MMGNSIIERCRKLAEFTEEPGFTTRTFLCEAMRGVHSLLGGWMEQAGMSVRVDAAGNLRGEYRGGGEGRLFIGSHLDTVPRAGAFDGVLGVVMGVSLVEALAGRRMKFTIEVVGFSEEEGVRFGAPFIGSRALMGDAKDLLDLKDGEGISVASAIRAFGLDPTRLAEARAGEDAIGYAEFHIEQGPVLESLDLPLGVVEAIVGQSRAQAIFRGQANHAGTTPMNLRHDALAGAAEWTCAVEREAKQVTGMVATVGRIDATPGAGNVIAGEARVSLDVRHAMDGVRRESASRLRACAEQIAARRGLGLEWEQYLDQAAVAMDPGLVELLDQSGRDAGYAPHRMVSGAGHDAMILAPKMPAAMLFLRSPAGLSHHPGESVLAADVDAALATGMRFLDRLEARCG